MENKEAENKDSGNGQMSQGENHETHSHDEDKVQDGQFVVQEKKDDEATITTEVMAASPPSLQRDTGISPVTRPGAVALQGIHGEDDDVQRHDPTDTRTVDGDTETASPPLLAATLVTMTTQEDDMAQVMSSAALVIEPSKTAVMTHAQPMMSSSPYGTLCLALIICLVLVLGLVIGMVVGFIAD